MKKALGNIGKIIWAPLIFAGMQFVVGNAYVLLHGIVVFFRMALAGEDIENIDPAKLEETIISSINWYLPMFISAAATFLFVFLIMHKEWKTESFWSFEKVKANPMILVMCAGFGISANLFMAGFMAFLPIPEHEQPFEVLLGDNLFLMFFTLAIVAPVIEEIVFRGIVQKKLMKMMRVPGAIILQAVIFGAVHLDFYQGTYTVFIGIMIGIIYLWYDSIYIPITIHVAFNATSVMLYHIAGDAEINAGVFMIMTGAALFISMGFLIALAGRRPKALYKFDNNGYNYGNNNNDDDTTPPFVG